VSPRDVTAPADATQASIEAALAQLGDAARLVAFHRDIGQAVVALPPGGLEKLKAALGPDFMVDPRSRLNIM
jgi:hypothetical protein